MKKKILKGSSVIVILFVIICGLIFLKYANGIIDKVKLEIQRIDDEKNLEGIRNELLNNNQKIYEEKLKNQYNPDNLFKNKKQVSQNKNDSTALVKYKENIIQ